MKPVSYPPDLFFQPSQRTKPVILAVEDNEDNLLLIAYIVELLDCNFIGESDGTKTLEVAKNCQPDIILLDVMLPDISGFEILASLRADFLTRHIPVIAVTALALLEDQRKIEEAGFDEYITKPYPLEVLEAVISKYLRLNTNN